MATVKQLKQRFDTLVEQREQARQRIDPDIENSDADYLRLEQQVNAAYRELMDARYATGYGQAD